MFRPEDIPGQIEPAEQLMLTRLAASPFVRDGGVIVEFGSFFGRSTACLLNGAAAWWTSERGPVVQAIDSFACAGNGVFAPDVRAAAARGGVQHLVKEADGRLDFLAAYRHYVGVAEREGRLRTQVGELRDAVHDGAPISLMHVDAPKFYEELKFVLFRFCPYLAPGGVVVFQDYFFHWSATLIAAVQLAVERGLLVHEASAASALTSRVVRAPTAADLLEIDLAMSSSDLPAILDRSLAAVEGLPLDRPEQFLPRVSLAKVQLLWSRGDYPAAQRELMKVIEAGGGTLAAPVFQDFRHLLHHGFDWRRLYDLDR